MSLILSELKKKYAEKPWLYEEEEHQALALLEEALAALEMVRNCLVDAPRDSRHTEALEKAQAVIAKAKG